MTDEPVAARSGGSRNQLAKAFRVLAVMAESGATDLGVREIAAIAPMAPSTVHRLLGDLEELGLVSAERGARYALGVELRRLAALATAESWPEATARQQIARLHTHLHVPGMPVTVLLTVYEPHRAQVAHFAVVGAAPPVRFLLPTNRWLPAHSGAAAQAILAFRPSDEQVAAACAAGAESAPVAAAADLEGTLTEIRARGYAIGRGRGVGGAVVVAAPIPELDQHPRASLAVVVPTAQHPESRTPALVTALRETAAAVGNDLAGHGGVLRLMSGTGRNPV